MNSIQVKMSAVGFEPTRIAPPELESGALDRSAKLTGAQFLVGANCVTIGTNTRCKIYGPTGI